MKKTIRLSDRILATYQAAEENHWPESRVRRIMLYKIARTCLDKNDERIFIMRFREQMKQKQIAREIKLSERQVKTKISKIKRIVVRQYKTFINLVEVRETYLNRA